MINLLWRSPDNLVYSIKMEYNAYFKKIAFSTFPDDFDPALLICTER